MRLLGDLGADVIKIESPSGDDTRHWGPPFVKDGEGRETDLSAYFVAANRNKRSISVDLATPAGREPVLRLLEEADVVIENFKPGGLKRFGLDAESCLARRPDLVYCSISGFGQTGPNAHLPGYDIMAQGFGGIMSLTGDPSGQPMKVGVGIADVMCGMYATVGILAALRHRDTTGEGQHVELALIDSQIAWLINEGTNYLVSGAVPKRRGNAHPNIAPYQVYRTRDGHVIVAVGNDGQFRRFCATLGMSEAGEDPRFRTNPQRLSYLDALNAVIEPCLAEMTTDAIVSALEAAGVPAGAVNTIDKVFASDQVSAREMRIELAGENGAVVPMIGNPLKLSRTPVTYRRPPPRRGAHND
jgi:crotonobetainyl-CoA:carnitine CoA-transferase CaiB-like acyl-CoA transferase